MAAQVELILQKARADQLALLARSWQCPVPDAIERLIADMIAQGELPDVTPGLEVVRFGHRIAFRIDAIATPSMNEAQASRIAGAMTRMATSRSPGFKAGFDDGSVLAVERIDGAIRVRFIAPDSQAAKTVTPHILADLARQFRSACDACR